MNKQSVILTKWVRDSNTLLEDFSQLALLIYLNDKLEVKKELNQIEKLIANSDVGTKWKLTLEKVE
jgi:hypothetical protein